MSPAESTRCWRKTRRKALRGVKTGRRATRQVKTTYGHRQRERDRRLVWQIATARAEMEAAMTARQQAA